MKGHSGFSVKTFFLILAFFFICCEKKEVHSYEKPLFSIQSVLKDEYLGLFFLDKKMGYFHGAAYSVAMGGKKGYYLSGDAVIKIEAEQEKVYTILKEEILLDENFKTVYFNYSQKIGDTSLNIVAKKQGNEYALKSISAGREEESTLSGEFLPLSAAGFIVWKKGIEENRRYEFKVFVEAMQKTENLTITVGKKEKDKDVYVYPLHQKLGNIEITSYVLENGDTYKEESIQGFTMRAMKKEEAIKFDEKAPTFYDLFSFTVIPVDVEIKDNISELVLLASGFDEKVKIPESEYQKVEKVEGGYKISVSATPVSKGGLVNLDRYLVKTMKIQKDAKEIKDLAKKLTKDGKDNKEKASIIVDWVNKNIKKRLKDNNTALDVLITREGECESHAMLVTAMLRSIDIPAKIVGGIVYSREHKGFLYHAWNEVWVDNHFLPVDATFGEFPAKPYHIKLTEENNMEDIIFFLGKTKIKILAGSGLYGLLPK